MISLKTSSSLTIITIAFLSSLVNCLQDTNGITDQKSSINRLLVISSVSEINHDSFIRFNRSIEAHNLRLVLLKAVSPKIDSYSTGLASQSDLRDRHKRHFEALKSTLSLYKNEQDLVLLLIDGTSSIINGNEQAILSRFEEFNRSNGTHILFSADKNCWPDSSLGEKYPAPQPADVSGRQRFLSSRALIGFAPSLWELFENDDHQQISDKSSYDLQLYATHSFLSKERREKLKIELDYRSSLFENLDDTFPVAERDKQVSALSSIELEFVNSTDEATLKNSLYNSRPLIVLASGSHAKIELNSLGNYLAKAWTPREGCRHCNESMISLASIKDADLPSVLIGVFIEEPTPFMESFFDTLRELNYPKQRIHLFVHNSIEYHERHVAKFLDAHGSQYASQELSDHKQRQHQQAQWLIEGSSSMSEWQAREHALKKCQQVGCQYYLSLDSLARLEWPESLRALIETNRTIVAPLLSRPGKLWSNFWGAMTREGYYERAHDYVELVARNRLGVWNVPLVMSAYLIEGKFLRHQLEADNELAAVARSKESGGGGGRQVALAYHDDKFASVKPELIFARNLRQANVFQYVTNMHDFGHLVDPTNYNTTHLHPDLYQLELNKHDWEREYLHENYTDLFDERDEDEKFYPNRIRLEQPCQDVFWFPLVSDKFCDQLVEMMERFGRWSSGTNSDPRIEGGYESVPTRDIHFKQVGLHDLWLQFLREYVTPVQLKEYIGYEHDPPRTDLAFVVRYHPSEQPSLRPHHDSSTFTLNIALNAPGKDYEGGGCRFVRYNCSVTESRKGWALIHPGRLTHYHEGLPVTKGTRYILVTFIDP